MDKRRQTDDYPDLQGAEKINPYNASEAKHTQVERMFDNIASVYDRMNAIMSFGLYKVWRDAALHRAKQALCENARLDSRLNAEPARILDVACGTGDLTFRLASLFAGALVTGLDLSNGMLEVADAKKKKYPQDVASRISFCQGDCLELPFDDNGFDLVTVAYGVRNFEHLEQGYKEMLRVLRPGGVICVVELSVPQSQLLSALYKIYSGTLIPVAGKIMSGDTSAYAYLPRSIEAAPQRIAMARVLQKAGFRRCRWKSMTLGVVTVYIAHKPFDNK